MGLLLQVIWVKYLVQVSRLVQAVEAHHRAVGGVEFQAILLPMEADVEAERQAKDQEVDKKPLPDSRGSLMTWCGHQG
ncbi:MAG: hypothetical protein AAF810_24275 [Cyanobacteria bacterium P01_D01_bin.36]